MPLPPKSNINDPIRAAWGYRPYTSPLAKEDEPAEKLDLNGLDFSIDDFQKVSKGKYNAGIVVLTSKGKLDIANNHRHFTCFNGANSDAADAFAIRVAFANALEEAGVTGEKIKAIRKRLGLRWDSSFGNNVSLAPLTRQEIREIIDDNIGTINADRANGAKLQSQSDLQAGLSDATKTARKNIRDALNEEMMNNGHMNLYPDFDCVNRLLTFKDFSEFSLGTLKDMKEFAEQFMSALHYLDNKDTKKLWRAENGSAPHFEQLEGGDMSVMIYQGDGYEEVYVRLETPDKTLNMSLGLCPADVEKRLNRACKYIEAAIENVTFESVPKDVAEAAVQEARDFIKDQEKKNVADARGFQKLDITQAKMAQAAALVKAHGAGLTEKGIRLLAANALNVVCSKENEICGNASAIVARIAKDIQSWRSFKAGDPLFREVEKKLCEHAQEVLDDYLAPKNAQKFEDNLFDSFRGDAKRAVFKIDGATYGINSGEEPEALFAAFKESVTNPAHQKAISTLMNQMTSSFMESMSGRQPLEGTSKHPGGRDFSSIPGIDRFIRGVANTEDNFYVTNMPALPDVTIGYELEVAEDGKSATVTVAQEGNILFNVSAARDGSNNHVARFTRSMKFSLDLSDEKEVKIKNIRISQDYDSRNEVVVVVKAGKEIPEGANAGNDGGNNNIALPEVEGNIRNESRDQDDDLLDDNIRNESVDQDDDLLDGNIRIESGNQGNGLFDGNIINGSGNQGNGLFDGNFINESGNQGNGLFGGNFIQPKIRQPDAFRKVSAVHNVREIEEEPSNEDLEGIANQNLDTLATLMDKQYGFGKEVATGILKQVEGWEWRLAKCSTAGNPTHLSELNDDLKEFFLENLDTIQTRIDQTLADMRT